MMDDATTRDLVRAAAAQIPTRPIDPDQLIARAGNAPRPSRRALGAVAAVLAVLAATGVIGVLVDSHRSSHGDQHPTGRHTTSSTAAPSSVAAWVRALPPGALPQLPYFKGREFFNGSQRVGLKGYPYKILGAAPHGFLVQEIRSGYEFRYGIVHGNGHLTWLTVPTFDPIETMSKDQRQLAIAGGNKIQIVDLVNERVTATFRSDSPVADLIAVTDRGVLFDTDQTYATGQANLWSAHHPVRVLPFQPFAASIDLRHALVRSGGSCADAVEVLPEETTLVVYHGCGNARPISLSPDGLHALTPDLHTIDLRDGSAHAMSGTGTRPGFAQLSFQDHQIAWEDDTHALIELTTTGRQDGPGTSALIRCSTAGECERLFAHVPRHPASGYYDVQLLDPTTQP
jgi:hypothetical protein